ncbi:hypothetical protein ACTMTJ_38340 [Phytohabitans sp. LJ34]|uniref:hypothetical protein n=1 Tax=Phytohabitans sp. LJ34 TaxID=3452217 RepID=UPI003F8BA102
MFAAGGLLMLAEVDLSCGRGYAATLGLGVLTTVATVVCVGWVEDLAARRRPVLLPPARLS